MKRWKIFFSIILVGIAIFLYGCEKAPEQLNTQKKASIMIPVVFLIDPATNLSNNQEMVETFNKIYEGQYYIHVEWLTESAAGYREKLKYWNVLDEMPAIITDAGFDYDFYQMMVKNNRLVNLKPYMEASSQWKAAMNPEVLEECTTKQGEIYLSPLANGVQSYAGIIYNKKLLKQAGYETFPKTWKEFWKCLDDLQAKGITPLSLHGSGSYWVSMLMATSYIESTPEGRKFLSEDLPKNYENSSMSELLKMLKRLYTFTFKDSLDIDYDEAAQRFCDGEAAIFANGYWMIQDMPRTVKETMRFAPFPENILMNSPRMSAWAITSGYDEEVIEGAVKFLEYRIQRDLKNTEKLLKGENLNSLEQSYIDTAQSVKNLMPNYQMKWEQEIQNEFFTEYMPQYIDGTIELKQFMKMLNDKITEIQNKK